MSDAEDLKSLVDQVRPAAQVAGRFPLVSVTDPAGFLHLADGWTGASSSGFNLTTIQAQLDELIDQLVPPPDGKAPSVADVIKLCRDAVLGTTVSLITAMDGLDKLNWPDRFAVFTALNAPSSLENATELEGLEGLLAHGSLPNVNPALHAGMIAVLLGGSGRTLSDVDVAINFTQALISVPPIDQLNLLGRLGVHGAAAQGTIASITGEAIAGGLIQPAAVLVDLLAANQARTAIGAWNKPGNMPAPYYIGLEAHRLIALEYIAVNGGHWVWTNTIPVDSILLQLQSQLMFKGNRLAMAMALSKPDIFHFSFSHPSGAPGWVFEIKPWQSLPVAEAEALFYADALIRADIPTTPGPVGAPGSSGCVPAPGGWYVFACVAPGAIVYWYRRATNEERQARGLEPVADPSRVKIEAAVKAVGASVTVVGALAMLLEALKDVGWVVVFA